MVPPLVFYTVAHVDARREEERHRELPLVQHRPAVLARRLVRVLVVEREPRQRSPVLEGSNPRVVADEREGRSPHVQVRSAERQLLLLLLVSRPLLPPRLREPRVHICPILLLRRVLLGGGVVPEVRHQRRGLQVLALGELLAFGLGVANQVGAVLGTVPRDELNDVLRLDRESGYLRRGVAGGSQKEGLQGADVGVSAEHHAGARAAGTS